jgi:hypothetical protein
MSLRNPSATTPTKDGRKDNKLFKLSGASEHGQWKSSLQDYMFEKFSNVNMDLITPASTLDPAYFKDHADFKVDFKASSKDGDNRSVDPFDHNPVFAGLCFDHAIATGQGFFGWLYKAYTYIRNALSDKIQRQTAVVRRGDLIGLLKAIQLAVHQFEIFDPDDLDIAFTKCTMAGEGGNDLMTFLSVLAAYILRLEAVNLPPTQKRKMRVLLNGLDQDVFSNFISAADRAPYKDYAALQFAVESLAAKPRTAQLLRQLKPGLSEALHVTMASSKGVKSPNTQRFDRIELMLATVVEQQVTKGRTRSGPSAAVKGKKPCYNMRDHGKCARGDACPFDHGAAAGSKRVSASAGNQYCDVHGPASSHSTADCNLLLKNTRLKAILMAEASSKDGNGRPAGAQIHATAAGTDNGYSFIYMMRAVDVSGPPAAAAMSQCIFTMRATATKIDLWCIDGASTTMATWDRARCFNIRKCSVQIFGSNSSDGAGKLVCTEMGDTNITTYNKATGKRAVTLVTNVLISDAFPFHIFSEIVAFDRGNACTKTKDSWTFFNRDGGFVFNGSQRLLNDPDFKDTGDSSLYWIDQAPPLYANDVVPLASSSQFSCRASEYLCAMRVRWSPLAASVPAVSGVARPRFECSGCAFDQVKTGPNICIKCFGFTAPPRVPSAVIARAAAEDGAPVSTTARPRFVCVECDFEQAAVGPNICIKCFAWSPAPPLLAPVSASICATRHQVLPYPSPVASADTASIWATTGAPRLTFTSARGVTPVAGSRLASAVPGSLAGPPLVKPLSTAKNLQMLVELHCAHDHRNFDDVAKYYGLSVPSPRPQCWACLMAKPRHITPDKVSTRRTERVYQGFAADAKGPITTPTPEGYRYFFLIVCLFSSYYWTMLAKAQSEWKDIWPAFVKYAEAATGKAQTVSFIITDGHKVHSSNAVAAFNTDRGIETLTTAPYSQWQDPAERGIQTVMNGARASLIHGGGKEWMWGWAVQHSADSANRMPPPHPLPEHEGKSRLRIMDPSVTLDKEMRTHRPFLCLCFKTRPKPELGSNFNVRADPCVYMRYDRLKKAYALLTIPNLYVTYCVEVRFVAQAYPLRVTNYLSNQLDTFLRPSVEDELYSSIHGPANMLRRKPIGARGLDSSDLVQTTPALVRAPVDPAALPGPGWSSSRGFVPTLAGLQSAACGKPTPPGLPGMPSPSASAAVATTTAVQTFTADQLAARTPRNGHQALRGPDVVYWVPGIKKDFAVIRDNKCIINVTDVRPPGPPPPPVEQRFKIKHRSDVPVALADIQPGNWKARTVARGDRFKYGLHYDATAAPVIHIPALKMLVAWAVAKGLLLYQWDVGAAFYGNKMDRAGVIVQLPPGYDPDSTDIRPLHLPPLYGELAGALPGIPQGSLLHYEAMKPELKQLGFLPLAADNCLFLHDTLEMATSLFVDDGVLACPSLKHAEQVLGPSGLGGMRKITWGPLRCTLGIDFDVSYTAERRLVFMSQRSFAVTILERAGMLDCNSTRLPASAGRVYSKSDCPTTDEQKADLVSRGHSKEAYHSVQASLNFLVSITRDDLRFINGKLAKYCSNPGEEHFKAQKQELRFLKGTLDYGIQFAWLASDPAPLDGPLDIKAWSDSSYADDKDTGRTTLAGIIQVNGAVVSSSSKLSSRVDSCVNHSELHAFAQVVGSLPVPGQLTDGAATAMVRVGRTVAWVRGVKAGLERRKESTIPPTPVFVDNSGVLAMLKDTTLKSANKHIYRALQENRERVHLDKAVVAVKVDTKDNIANAMTKQEHGVAESTAQLLLITGPRSQLYNSK